MSNKATDKDSKNNNNINKQNQESSLKPLKTKQEATKPTAKKEQDPTRFGDWQVNGRAIDF